jgi:ABC-2 type transport system permease protein
MLGSYTWTWHVLTLELRKVFAYRVTFWVQFVVRILTEILVAYFLWEAVFSANNATLMNGFSFHGILFYYLFAAFCSRIVQDPSNGEISMEIYQGGLTRYLFYPISFFLYKFICCFAYQLLAVGQMIVCIAVAIWIWKNPSDQSITISSLILGTFTSLVAGYVYFVLGACLEQVAFWQDTVWNLLAMLRFVGGLLGGLLIPLSFFPEWGKLALNLTPFPYVYGFPIRCFLGQVHGPEWISSMAVLVFWALVFTFLSRIVWNRGLKNYSGVGI